MRKPFTPEEDQFIRDHIKDWNTKKIGEHLHRTSQYICHRARELGYGNVLDEKLMKSQFKKGSVSFNKGMKMEEYLSQETVRKLRKHQFKKGQKPCNTKYNGHISKRYHKGSGTTYYFIRVKKGKYVHLHRHVWEKANGPIPEGMIVVFRDGDSENVCLENLEMISMEENMLRNSIHDYPEEIIPTMTTISKIKSKIKKHEKHT